MKTYVLATIAGLCFVALGCKVQEDPAYPQPPPPGQQPPPPGPTATQPPPPSTGPAPATDCPNPADHCLPTGELYFATKKQWKGGYVWVNLSTMKTPPDSAGEAKFFLKRNGSDLITKWFYKTRPARRSELAIGQMVVMFHDNKKDRVYRAPDTRKAALGKRWWMSRIVSLAPLGTGNFVLVADGYRVAANNLRLVVGDKSKTTTVASGEDAHFLSTSHWFVSTKPLRNKGYHFLKLAAPITVPSAQTKNEGLFITLRRGNDMWTKFAWRTRPAKKAELKPGLRVFMFHDAKRDGVYNKPAVRHDALAKRWWTGLITDTSTAYKGTVTVAGKYQVAVDNLRVAMP